MAEQIDKQEQSSGFMQRWSQRKIETQSLTSEMLFDEKNIAISESKEPAPVVAKTDADMIPIDQLTEESDFSDFLSPKVSATLRKHALRKLFHMPFLNVVDGLDDYAEDYTNFEPLGDIVTHEMKRMFEREKLKAEQELNTMSSENNEADTRMDETDPDSKQSELSAIEQQPKVASQEMTEEQELINLTDEIENEKLS